MLSHFRFAGVVFVGILFQVSAQNALTNEEIQILRDNGYAITIDKEDDTVTYEHHGVPIHSSEKDWGNPNDAEKVNHSYTMPLKPTVAAVKGCAGGLGVIGLAVSGGAYYNPYTGFGWNAVEGECAEELDSCRGHPSPDGTYHYHGVPECLYTGDLRDKFLGVALDGYPIYGPMDSTGKNWTSADLDICHGHTYNGRYMYRATYDFPYIISCFHGKDVKSRRHTRPPPPGTGQRPPPPRTERLHPVNHDTVHHPIPLPPGIENDKCWNAKFQDWDTRICHVVCKNAGQDLENCQTNATGAGTTDFNTASIFNVLTLTSVFYIIL